MLFRRLFLMFNSEHFFKTKNEFSIVKHSCQILSYNLIIPIIHFRQSQISRRYTSYSIRKSYFINLLPSLPCISKKLLFGISFSSNDLFCCCFFFRTLRYVTSKNWLIVHRMESIFTSMYSVTRKFPNYGNPVKLARFHFRYVQQCSYRKKKETIGVVIYANLWVFGQLMECNFSAILKIRRNG